MDDDTRAVLKSLTERMRWMAERHEREWRDAAHARDVWGAELDALIAEVNLLKARIMALEGTSMADREKLLGQDLTQTIAAMNELFRRRLPPEWEDDCDLFFVLLGNFWAHTLGRLSSMVAAPVVDIDQRVTKVEADVAELKARSVGDGNT